MLPSQYLVWKGTFTLFTQKNDACTFIKIGRGERISWILPEYFETKQNNNNKPFFQFLICFQICCIVRWEEMEGNHRKIHINNIKQKPYIGYHIQSKTPADVHW